MMDINYDFETNSPRSVCAISTFVVVYFEIELAYLVFSCLFNFY